MKITTQLVKRAFLAFCLLLFAGNMMAQDVFEDDFSTAHNYVADSIAGTIWDGYMLNSGVDATQDAELFSLNTTDVPGSLYIKASNTDFEGAEDDGAFLYKVIPAHKDFEITVKIGPNSNFSSFDGVIYYNAAGLMVKHPVADSVDFLNLLAFDMPGWGAVHLVKNVDGGVQNETANADADSIEANPWLRIKREAYKYTTYYGPDGVTWTEINSQERFDLWGMPLLVGIVQATFSEDTAYVEYDNLTITTSYMRSINDEFDAAHDYLADSTDGTFWDGYMLNSGVNATQDAELFTMNTTDVPGSLIIEASNTDWENAEDDGAFLYKIVGGEKDFDMSVMIGPNSNFSSFDGVIYYNAGGLMVKSTYNEDVDFLNLLAFDMPGWGAVHLVKNVDGGEQDETATAAADSIEANPWLRIKKSGYKFTAYWGPDGQEWNEILTVTREDMMMTELLVGIAQATFSNDTAYVEYDHFQLITQDMDLTEEGFDMTHDFMTDSTDGTIWDGYMLNSGVNENQDAELFAMNSNDDIGGSLYIKASNTDWENAEDDGAFLYQIVDADMDFDMVVKIGPNSNFSSFDGVIYYNAGGLMVKHPEADSVDFLNLLAFDMPGWGAVHLVKSVDGGDQIVDFANADADSIEANPWLRIQKTGSVFSCYYGSDKESWTKIFTTIREDLTGTPLLVGIAQATFSDDTAYVEYEDFFLLVSDPDLVPPTTPGTPEASNITTTSFDLDWDGSWDNLEMWNYDVLLDGEVISTQDTLELSVTDLEPNTLYTVMVIARDASGNIAESEPLQITTLETGVPAIIESDNFAMYPNPAVDVIMIEMNTSDLAEISIYNVQGKLVFSDQFTEKIVLERSQIGSSGFYIVKISTAESSWSRKLIVR